MARKRRPTPYQRIVRAVEEGRGVRLSFEDCLALARDHAIATRAEWDDAAEEPPPVPTR